MTMPSNIASVGCQSSAFEGAQQYQLGADAEHRVWFRNCKHECSPELRA